MTGAIMVRKHEAQIVATFECTSHTDITINFIDLSNIPRLIADCDAQVGSCYVYDSILAKYYAVTYTDEGTFVYIKNTTYTIGKYTCCETYNKTNCDSTELLSFDANDPNRSYVQIGNKQSEMIETDHSGRSDCKQGQSFDESLRMMKGFIISSFISILIFILILIGIFFRRLYLKGHLQRIKRTKSPKSINAEDTIETEEVPMIKMDNTYAHEDTLSMKDAPREVSIHMMTELNNAETKLAIFGNRSKTHSCPKMSCQTC